MSENGIRNDLKFLSNLVEKFNKGDSHLNFVSGFSKRINNLINEIDKDSILYHSLTKQFNEILETVRVEKMEQFIKDLEKFNKVVSLCENISNDKYKTTDGAQKDIDELISTCSFYNMFQIFNSLNDVASRLSIEIPHHKQLLDKYEVLFEKYKRKYFYIHMAITELKMD
jgi:hypothetical protein